MSGYVDVLYVRYTYIASTTFTVSDFCTLYCMRRIYGMESPIDTAQPPTVWDTHVSTDKVGLAHARPNMHLSKI